MKIITNRFIPPENYTVINLFGVLFARKGKIIDQQVIRHETIHTKQMKEMLYIPFYLWYVLEWCIKCLYKKNAYRNISFEREAYDNQDDLNYLKNRKHYSWVKYL